MCYNRKCFLQPITKTNVHTLKKIIIIGSGFSSLSAACYLAKEGYDVTIYEKNESIGGRARQLIYNGFTFDIGPTFYWMPDVFERFFADFGTSTKEFYELIRLDPGYEVYFDKGKSIRLSANFEQITHTFEQHEAGSSRVLKRFMKSAEINYRVAMDKVVYKPGKSPLELVMPATIMRVSQFFSSLSHTVRKDIKNPMLRQILEFPVLFLGARPCDLPSFYRFMNYADMILGTWHIQGGMFQLVKAMHKLATQLGVTVHTNSSVERIHVKDGKVTGVQVNGKHEKADVVVSGADYHHTESLLEWKYRNYSTYYWKSRVMAPSALLFYIGFDRELENVSHHTLFFDTDFDEHANKIYLRPGWPEKPLFYASFPTKTDKSIAPEGKDAAIILIPIAPGLDDTPEIRKQYFNQIIERMEKLTGQSLQKDILFYKTYAVNDFVKDYHAYKGNAYGLSNTLLQTAFLKPKIQNKKVRNLFYAGQLTVPGPGVPTTIISGKIAAGLAAAYIIGINSRVQSKQQK